MTDIADCYLFLGHLDIHILSKREPFLIVRIQKWESGKFLFSHKKPCILRIGKPREEDTRPSDIYNPQLHRISLNQKLAQFLLVSEDVEFN